MRVNEMRVECLEMSINKLVIHIHCLRHYNILTICEQNILRLFVDC